MMTRTDHKKLAQLLSELRTELPIEAFTKVAVKLTKTLSDDNPNFNTVRFLKAAGWEEE